MYLTDTTCIFYILWVNKIIIGMEGKYGYNGVKGFKGVMMV